MTAPRIVLLVLLLGASFATATAQGSVVEDDSVSDDFAHGMLLAARNDHENAVRVFDLVLLQSTRHVEFLNALAFSLLQLQRYERARLVLERALEIDSSDYIANFNLGILHAIGGRYALAIIFFEHALHAAPDDVDALYCIGMCHVDLGENGRAMDIVRMLATVDKDRAAQLLDYLNDTDLARNDPLAE